MTEGDFPETKGQALLVAEGSEEDMGELDDLEKFTEERKAKFTEYGESLTKAT